jgi:hypothetical protein
MSQVSFKQFCQLAELPEDELTEERLDEIWPFTDKAKQDAAIAAKAKADFEDRRLKTAQKAKESELARAKQKGSGTARAQQAQDRDESPFDDDPEAAKLDAAKKRAGMK